MIHESDCEIKVLTRNEFRKFDEYVSINFEDLYKNKVAYDVTYLDNDTFKVRLFHNPSVSFEDIPLAN